MFLKNSDHLQDCNKRNELSKKVKAQLPVLHF